MRKRKTPVPPPEWISVKERFPTRADGDAIGFVVWMRYFDRQVTYADWNDPVVLHWDNGWGHWMQSRSVANLPRRPTRRTTDKDRYKY